MVLRKLLAALLCATGVASASAASLVHMNIWDLHSHNSGTPSLTPTGTPYYSMDVANVLYGASKSWVWFPSFPDGTAFQAEFTGYLDAPVAGDYNLRVTADDGAYLNIDGSTAISAWYDEGPTPHNDLMHLTAGVHSFKVGFYENGWGDSGVDFTFPESLHFAPAPTDVPEPATVALMAAGLALLGFAARRKNSR